MTVEYKALPNGHSPYLARDTDTINTIISDAVVDNKVDVFPEVFSRSVLVFAAILKVIENTMNTNHNC